MHFSKHRKTNGHPVSLIWKVDEINAQLLMEFPHGTISIDTQPDKFTIEFLWWNWWNCCSWILISLLLQLNCHFIPLLLMMMIKQRKFWDALFHISYISIPVSKGISQSKRNFTTSKNCLHKKVSCEVSPIFLWASFFLPWPWNVMNFLDIPAPCWSCKVCKKSFVWFWKMSGEQSCLLYHVRCSLKFGGGRFSA